MDRSHALKKCDICDNNSEPLGGVEVRGKWYCAKCWIKLMNRIM